jgi:hypothetical protein
MKSKTRKAAGKASLDSLVGGDWAYPTVQDWVEAAQQPANEHFRAGFECARNEQAHQDWQVGYDMGRMTNALIRALAANKVFDK